ncbi:MAG: ferritin family protein [Sedimentisphaerales bacterium]|nr:ferritin family protein [Sedimentisphaerales bacterium]
MRKNQTDTEALEFAIFREVEANKLYKALAEAVKDVEIHTFFEELAAEEIEHKKKLELELMKLGVVVRDEDFSKGVKLSYLVEDGLPEDLSQADILQFAIKKENESFRMYVSLYAKTSDEETKEILLALAEEELRHKLRFEQKYQQLLNRK